jgi:hypothetical protein
VKRQPKLTKRERRERRALKPRRGPSPDDIQTWRLEPAGIAQAREAQEIFYRAHGCAPATINDWVWAVQQLPDPDYRNSEDLAKTFAVMLFTMVQQQGPLPRATAAGRITN